MTSCRHSAKRKVKRAHGILASKASLSIDALGRKSNKNPNLKKGYHLNLGPSELQSPTYDIISYVKIPRLQSI